MSDFNPKDCPVGVANEKNLEKLDTKVEMAIKRLEEKLDDMGKNMEKGFSITNKKLADLEKSLTDLNEKLPTKIDERIEAKRNNRVWEILRWVIVSIGGTVGVTAIVKAIWG